MAHTVRDDQTETNVFRAHASETVLAARRPFLDLRVGAVHRTVAQSDAHA